MKKRKGSVMEIMYVGIAVFAMTIVMMSYLNNMQLVSSKEDVNQVARKYILRMETMGYLDDTGRLNLLHDLQEIGVTDIDLSGTTLSDAGYGNPIYLVISGKLEGKQANISNIFNVIFEGRTVDIYEKRMSTAKN